ncbi:MAG: pyruvate dehydrogenase (acetyl-transferring) E1 component subunit alpha [Rhodospirillaceae bacterium]|nr:pyruvate dehydrogenase (acetyl-transferring) E1 component subunit alpha [Rhodospirillaceae bacterium]
MAVARKKRNDAAEATKPAASAEELLTYYRQMLLVRRFEERAGQMYGMGLIGGFCHLYIGQEAVVVGMEHAIDKDDAMITGYRCHAHAVTRGVDPKAVLSELTGRAAGISQGKGGSMHMFSPENGFYGGHGIVGAQVSLGTGIAFGMKYKKTDRVCVTYYGDGAANQGQVYESFNMAALWKLPVIYVVENNQYGMGTSVKRASASVELYRHGESLGIPGVQVDGMDVLAVKQAGDEAVKQARAGEGPVVLEMLTYRYRGHSMSDPGKYRTREEVQKMRTERDPINQLRERILSEKAADEAALKDIDREIKEIINEAAEFAQSAPEPDAAELYTDVVLEA